MKLSARNVIAGTVKHINIGSVNDEIIVEISGGHEIVSVITKSSVENLGLREGASVYVVIKASDVMLAVE